MPVCRCLRGLRVLEKQERNPTLKDIIGELALSIEGGSTFSEGLAQHPKVFNRLYVNMVKAGELGGVLEVVLNRLSEFMEKAQKIKGKVIAAMFYPVGRHGGRRRHPGHPDGVRGSEVQDSFRRHVGRRATARRSPSSFWASATSIKDHIV